MMLPSFLISGNDSVFIAIEQLISEWDPNGALTSITWCTCGGMGSYTDPNGHITSFSRDLEGRVTGKTMPDGTTFAYTYETTTSRLLTSTDPNGSVTTNTYNDDDSIQQIVYTPGTGVAATPTQAFVYDQAYPRVTTITTTGGTSTSCLGTTTYTYNPIVGGTTLGQGQLGSTAFTVGTGSAYTLTPSFQFTYDALGRVKTSNIGAANANTTTINNYDALGRITQTTNPLGQFNLGYLSNTGRLSTLSMPNGVTSTMSYADYNGSSFNAAIQPLLTEIKNVKGSTNLSKFDYLYDNDNRITQWTQTLDASPLNNWNYTYDPIGQLTAAVKTSSTNSILAQYAYSYDFAGNRTSEQIGMNVKTTSYNSLNQITGTSGAGMMQFTGTLSKPATVTVGGNPASVDANNNFRGFAAVTNGTNTVQIVAKDYSNNTSTNNYQVVQPMDSANTVAYDTLGNMTNNGNGQTYSWDAKNELVSINYSAPLQEKLVGAIIGTSGSYNNSGTVISNAFDGNAATYFDGPTASGCWLGLDLGTGNQAPDNQVKFTCRNTFGSRMVGGKFQSSNDPTFATGVTTLGTISTAPANGVSTIMSFTGAVAQRYVRYLSPNNSYGDIAELEFDTTVSSTAFSYDGLSRRVKIVEQNGSGTAVITKQHVWIGNSIAEERDGSNKVVKRFYTQGVQLNGTNYFYTRDHLGSIRELTTSTGTIAARYDYDPYGVTTLVQGTNLADFQYAGMYLHQPSGLYLTTGAYGNTGRPYEPLLGRWLQRDPIQEAGGINLYDYVGNTPINAVDPFGLYIIIGVVPGTLGKTNGGTFTSANPSIVNLKALLSALPDNSISSIFIDGHSDSHGINISDNENLALAIDASGNVIVGDHTLGTVADFGDLIRKKLAPNATVELRGCDTANESGERLWHFPFTDIASGPSITRLLASQLPGHPVIGFSGPAVSPAVQNYTGGYGAFIWGNQTAFIYK